PTSQPEPEPPTEPTTDPEPEPVTPADIQAWAAGAEWTWSDDGLDVPIVVGLTAGAGEDENGRTYQMGDGVEGDANGDGTADLAIPLAQTDGEDAQELWYVWLGREAGEAGEQAPAEQVIFPIALTDSCGDIVHSVTAIDSGFQIDHTLKMPWTDDERGCEEGGTGTEVRDVTIMDFDDEWYPVLTAPIEAWGGICPRSDWLEGGVTDQRTGRVAPPESATVIHDVGDRTGLYPIREAPLLEDGAEFFYGFLPGAGDSEAVEGLGPVRQFCAFTDEEN
ncbi:MAG: hypothetical protein L0G23_05210, partial [Ruaniaceae bacterium]|nr:hypothetical protein [Ruaniaceae bacterium]